MVSQLDTQNGMLEYLGNALLYFDQTLVEGDGMCDSFGALAAGVHSQITDPDSPSFQLGAVLKSRVEIQQGGVSIRRLGTS